MTANQISPVDLSAFITLFLLLLKTPHVTGFLNENGVVRPKDPFTFVGESLVLYCNITNDRLAGYSDDLYFEMESGQDVKTISRKYIETLTTKSVRLVFPHVRLEDDGVYSCYMKTYNRPKYIGHQIVKVDYRPVGIENVSCRVINWEKMICNWTLGADYQHMEDLEVELIWTMDGDQTQCPQMAANKTCCTWPPIVYLHSYKYLMKFRVTNLRRMEKVISPQMNVETRFYVEPAPINNFQATEENSTCLILTWQHPSLPERVKVFIAQYKPRQSNKWTKVPLSREESKKLYTTVCGLNPNTEYTFRMKVMPYPEYTVDTPPRNGFSSAWKTVSAKTSEDVPESAPQICSTCFFEHICHKSSDTHCPSIRIYWKEIPAPERNGIITGYQLTLLGKTNHSSMKNISREMKNFDFLLPSVNEEYKITIKAATRKGFSNKFSEIFIPSKSLRPSAPHDFLVQKDSKENENVVYYLHWDADKTKNLAHKSTVIVWCFGDLTDFTCKGYINWITLSAENVTYKIPLNADQEAQGNPIFGIAREVRYQNKIFSSGIQWASCIYHKNGKRPSAPVILHVTDLPRFSGLSVAWEKNDCPKDRVYVTGYSVSLCTTKDKQTCIDSDPNSRVVHVNNTSTHVEFKNLSPPNKYLVRVWAESNSVDGVKSIPAIGQVTKIPENEKVSKEAIIGLSICGALLLLCIFIAIYCCRRYCISRRNEFPSLDDEFMTTPYTKSNNHGYDKGRQGINSLTSPNGSISTRSTLTKTDPLDNKCMYGNGNSHQPLLQTENEYEQNVGMFSLPNANDETSHGDFVKADISYETPETNKTYTPKISGQSPDQEQKSNQGGSLNSSRSSGVVGDAPYFDSSLFDHSHPSPTSSVPVSEAHVALSDCPPQNEAPPPPSIPADKPRYGQEREQPSQASSPSSALHPKSSPNDPCIILNNKNSKGKPLRSEDCDSDKKIINLPPKTGYNISQKPRGKSLPDGNSKFVPPNQQPLNFLTSNGYSKFVPSQLFHDYSQRPNTSSQPVESHSMTPNSESVDSQTSYGYSTFVPSDHSGSNFQASNGSSKFVPSEPVNVYSQTPNSKPFNPHSRATLLDSNLPDSSLKLQETKPTNRNSVPLSDLNFPPPPSCPPPPPETNF